MRREAHDLDHPPLLALADGPRLDDPDDVSDFAFFVFVMSEKCSLFFDDLFRQRMPDLPFHLDSDRLLQKKIADNAYIWLFMPSHLFNSFENICMSLDILPEGVRTWVRGLSKDDIEKIEHLDREGKTLSPKTLCMLDLHQK
jgi:hypothetical protein